MSHPHMQAAPRPRRPIAQLLRPCACALLLLLSAACGGADRQQRWTRLVPEPLGAFDPASLEGDFANDSPTARPMLWQCLVPSHVDPDPDERQDVVRLKIVSGTLHAQRLRNGEVLDNAYLGYRLEEQRIALNSRMVMGSFAFFWGCAIANVDLRTSADGGLIVVMAADGGLSFLGPIPMGSPSKNNERRVDFPRLNPQSP